MCRCVRQSASQESLSHAHTHPRLTSRLSFSVLPTSRTFHVGAYRLSPTPLSPPFPSPPTRTPPIVRLPTPFSSSSCCSDCRHHEDHRQGTYVSLSLPIFSLLSNSYCVSEQVSPSPLHPLHPLLPSPPLPFPDCIRHSYSSFSSRFLVRPCHKT